MNSSTLSTSAASLSPEQQRLGDEHDVGGVTAKEKDGKIKARTAMRRLARLVEATERVTKAEELFVVANFYMLEQGIHNVCQTDADSDKQSKAGLKVTLSGNRFADSSCSKECHCQLYNYKQDRRFKTS